MILAVKSLIMLVLLFSGAIWFVRRAVFTTPDDRVTLDALKTPVFAILTLAFMAQNFWLYVVLGVYSVWRIKEKINPAFILAAVLFCVPLYQKVVYLPGGDGTFLSVSLQYAVIWLLFYKVAGSQEGRAKGEGKYVRSATDVFLLAWVAYQMVFLLGASTLTHAIKTSISEMTQSYFLYFIVSRAITTKSELVLVVKVFAFLCLALALVGVTESVRHWLLYSPIEAVLSISKVAIANYLERDSIGLLRSLGTAGHPIILGAILGTGVLFWIGLQDDEKSSLTWVRAALAVMVIGLLSTFSRGPWLATAAGYVTYVMASKDILKQLTRFIVVVGIMAGLLVTVPGGEKIIDMLPFVGHSESGSVDYRSMLLNICLYLFWENPWFGSTDYMSEPIMQSLVQGQGIIDMVNTYLSIAMSGGFVGLSIYLGIFLSALIPLGRELRKTNDKIHRAVFAAMVCLLITLATVSSINSLPLLCWMLLGLVKASTWVIQKEAQVG
jgi:O-antigen ligase